MANSYFQFKQFTIEQERSAMKVTTDSCLFGAWAAERIRNENSIINNCLDIGTGTGLLALMLAQKNEFSIDAVEIDKEAFEQASENITASHWANRLRVFYGDIRNPVATGFDFQRKYDMIISNPPFYEKELKGDNSKKNIAHHNEGLLLPELIELIKKNLNPGGSFYLLLPYKRNEEVRKILKKEELGIQQIT
ncbi:MAG: methyltransferase, partial [Bacteroidota bacterium]